MDAEVRDVLVLVLPDARHGQEERDQDHAHLLHVKVGGKACTLQNLEHSHDVLQAHVTQGGHTVLQQGGLQRALLLHLAQYDNECCRDCDDDVLKRMANEGLAQEV